MQALDSSPLSKERKWELNPDKGNSVMNRHLYQDRRIAFGDFVCLFPRGNNVLCIIQG